MYKLQDFNYNDNEILNNVEELDSKYVNIAKYSDSELGTMLSPGYGYKFDTFIGTVGSVRTALDFIVTPNYPKDILVKTKLNKNDIRRIPKDKVSLPNYKAVMALILADRINNDETVKSLLLHNSKEIVSYNRKLSKSLVGNKTIITTNSKMYYYTVIIRAYETMLSDGNFDKEHISQFIESCKTYPEKDLFEGLPFIVK